MLKTYVITTIYIIYKLLIYY